jgi:hypothetical protein
MLQVVETATGHVAKKKKKNRKKLKKTAREKVEKEE